MQTEAVSALIRDVAERVVRPRWRALEAHQVIEKNPGDLVTVADREAEAEITRALLADDASAVVVGEEATFARPQTVSALPGADHAWTVDPVDGTRNFVNGSPDYAVMIAETRAGVTTRGWIWLPEHDELWVAERGAGVTVNGTPVRRGAAAVPYRGAASRRQYRGWRSADVAPIGGTRWACGADYPAMLRGDSDFVLYYNANPWDHLPGALMLAEIGGTAVMRDGRPYAPGVSGKNLCAAVSPDVARAAVRAWDGGPLA